MTTRVTDAFQGPALTTTRVRLPIDDVVERAYQDTLAQPDVPSALSVMAQFNVYVRDGVFALVRGHRPVERR